MYLENKKLDASRLIFPVNHSTQVAQPVLPQLGPSRGPLGCPEGPGWGARLLPGWAKSGHGKTARIFPGRAARLLPGWAARPGPSWAPAGPARTEPRLNQNFHRATRVFLLCTYGQPSLCPGFPHVFLWAFPGLPSFFLRNCIGHTWAA